MQTSDLFAPIKTKRCPCCGKELESFNFYSSRTAADGLQSYCKRCQKLYRQKHPTKEYKQHHKDNLTLQLW